MSNDAILAGARTRISVEVEAQRERLEIAIQTVRGEMNARGVMHSSMTLQRIAKICADAAMERATFALLILQRFVQTGSADDSPTFGDELKAVIVEILPEALGDLQALATRDALNLSNIAMVDSLLLTVEVARRRAVIMACAEIDLFIMSLRNGRNMPKKQQDLHTIIINSSTVGSIQTGDNAIANVSQKFDDVSLAHLSELLERLISVLGQENVVIANQSKSELIEVVQDA